MPSKLWLLLFNLLLISGLGCGSTGLIKVIPRDATPTPQFVPQTQVQVVQTQPDSPTATPYPPPDQATTKESTPAPAQEEVATAQTESPPSTTIWRRLSFPKNAPDDSLPAHGLLLAFIIPVLILGIPSIFLELAIVRYVQPRGIDLSEVLVRAKDGLFVGITLSMTARRTLSLASTRMTWSRVREFVEKSLEQELIQRANTYESLDDLEHNLRAITEGFQELPIIRELSRDFGVVVLRFNAEIRYTPETVTALNNRAEASAGGLAYLAYAAAAHLNPESAECRELYRVYQQTTSRVEAARNLGSGIANFGNALAPKAVIVDDDQTES